MRRNIFWGLALTLSVCCLLTACGGPYETKVDTLRDEIVTEDIAWELGSSPAGEAGHVIFLSVCDGTRRASVFTGTGATLEEAWEDAENKTAAAVGTWDTDPIWVKADVVYVSEEVSREVLVDAVSSSRPQFFRYGAAFDPSFDTALLEAELNGAGIYRYEDGGVDLSALNDYLEGAGRPTLEGLPETYTLFQTFGWLCDENDAVHLLDSSGLDYGRRTLVPDDLDAQSL